MRFTFVILLFLSLGSDAQMIIKAHPNYVPLASANLLLDQYSGAAAAYSLRKLRTAYTGNAIRVRRSNDNTEQDIGFTASGDLDTASLKTFVSGSNGFVTTWYDQSGNARNATQTTANGQPRIMQPNDTILRLNNNVSIVFNGATWFTHPVIQTSPTRLYIFSSLSSATQGAAWWGHRSESTRLIQFQHAAASNSVVLNLRSNANVLQTVSIGTFTASQTSNFLASARFDVANNTHISYLNGTASATNTTNFSGQTFNSTVNSIGAVTTNGTTFSSGFLGRMHELIIYTSDQSSNRTEIETNINSYYGIY
jgi:hypothetical protein